MKYKIMIGILFAALIVFNLFAGSVIAHNIAIKELSKTPYKEADGNKVYTTTKPCEQVSLVKSTWKHREIISMKNYVQARHPHRTYCGIIYKFVK